MAVCSWRSRQLGRHRNMQRGVGALRWGCTRNSVVCMFDGQANDTHEEHAKLVDTAHHMHVTWVLMHCLGHGSRPSRRTAQVHMPSTESWMTRSIPMQLVGWASCDRRSTGDAPAATQTPIPTCAPGACNPACRRRSPKHVRLQGSPTCQARRPLGGRCGCWAPPAPSGTTPRRIPRRGAAAAPRL